MSEATGEIEELSLGKSEFLDDHFTIIRLENILETQKENFSDNRLYEYLSRVIPAPFNKEKFLYASEIEEWLKQNKVFLPNVNIELNNKKIYRPPYESEIYLNEITKQPFYDEDENLMAVAWIATIKLKRDFKWPKTGIFFKRKGFTIGDENLVKSYFTSTYNQWYYGEIHIISDKIRENAPRNNFEYNHGNVLEFIDHVNIFIHDLQLISGYRSDKADAKNVTKIQSLVESGNYKEAEKEIKKQKNRLTKKSRRFPDNPYLEPLKKQIDLLSDQDAATITQIEKELEVTKIVTDDTIKKKRDEIYEIIDAIFPKSAANEIKRTKKGYELDIVITSTDVIKDILKAKSGLDENNMKELCRTAFGWDGVTKKNDPILFIDENQWVNRNFGVMVYAVHDMFVNKFKHEQGEDSFKWFHEASDEQKYDIIKGMYSTLGLIYRLIESSKKSNR